MPPSSRIRFVVTSCLLATGASVGAMSACAQESPRPSYERRWFYARQNLLVKEQAETLITLINRASKVGYNGVVIADYKLSVLDDIGSHYFDHIRLVKQAAARAKMEIIPAIYPIGYSNGLLSHDPNLAEGIPVIDAPFVVRGNAATSQGAGKNLLINGGFEEIGRPDTFKNFAFQDNPGSATFADTKTVREGRTSLRFAQDPSAQLRRIMQAASVRPHTAYRLSVWVKTHEAQGLGGFNLMAIGNPSGRVLTYVNTSALQPSQDWKQLDVVFNSLDQSRVSCYVGLWNNATGSVWIDDLRLEEIGPINVLRRPGCPIRVRSEDGKTVYEEGRDFGRLEDPKLGRVPYAGVYDYQHPAPPVTIPRGSRIRDGQAVHVSWYHPILIRGDQVVCCPSERATYDHLRDQTKRVNALFRPKTFFMSHDEIRVMNWCAACQSRKATPGQILADNATRCVNLIREVRPDAEIVVWSDMFDPFHNAVDQYYLVNGSLKGSWEGLPREVTIANWYLGKSGQGLRFFSDRGHRQILAGYYDVDDLSNFQSWDAAAAGVKGVNGFMYTTWENRFELLEAYGRAMRRQP